MNRKAEMGVGTLIIFISLLLVAAVAAGVLIQTSGTLQQKALATGQQATGQISTKALALEVSAVEGSDGAIENYTMLMKLAPGSDPINLDDVTMTYSTSETTITFQYRARLNSSHYCAGQTLAENCATVNSDEGNFTVQYIQQGANYQNGTLGSGDVIAVYWPIASSVGEGESIRLTFIPKTGSTTQILFDTPDVMSTQRVYLYP